MFPHLAKAKTNLIGERNVLVTHHLLTSLGVSITAQHVGGTGHRNIIFDVWSGDVWVQYQPIIPTVAYPATRRRRL